MTQGRGRSRGRRQSVTHSKPQQGLWDAAPSPGVPEPIQVAPHPGAVIESLGPPSLRGSASTVEHYVAAVVERAASVAAALAASAGLLAETTDDDVGGPT